MNNWNNRWWGGVRYRIRSLSLYLQLLPLLYTAAQIMSGLLVLEFTVEQYIAICYPFKRTRYCRVSIARKVILGTFQHYTCSACCTSSSHMISDPRQSIFDPIS